MSLDIVNLSTCNFEPSLSPSNIGISNYGISHTYTYSSQFSIFWARTTPTGPIIIPLKTFSVNVVYKMELVQNWASGTNLENSTKWPIWPKASILRNSVWLLFLGKLQIEVKNYIFVIRGHFRAGPWILGHDFDLKVKKIQISRVPNFLLADL